MPDMDNVTKSRFSFEGPGDRSTDCQSKALLFSDGDIPMESAERLPIAETIYTIETEVIPRLLISARTPRARTASTAPLPFLVTAPKPEPRLEAEVAILTQIVLLDEAHAACTFISTLPSPLCASAASTSNRSSSISSPPPPGGSARCGRRTAAPSPR